MAMQTQHFIHISILRILIHVYAYYAWMRTFTRIHFQLMKEEKEDFISVNFIFIIIIIEMLSFHIKIVFLIRIFMIFFCSHGGKSNSSKNNIVKHSSVLKINEKRELPIFLQFHIIQKWRLVCGCCYCCAKSLIATKRKEKKNKTKWARKNRSNHQFVLCTYIFHLFDTLC